MRLSRESVFSLGLGALEEGGSRFATPSWKGARQGARRGRSQGSNKYFSGRDRGNFLFSERNFSRGRAAASRGAANGGRNRGYDSDFGGGRSGDDEFSSKRFEGDFSSFRGRPRRGGHMRS